MTPSTRRITTLHNRRGLTRGTTGNAVPVTVGVPMARTVLADSSHLVLVDPAGRRVPLQARTLDTWPDGSVRWVLLDYQVPANDPGPYGLEIGSEQAAPVGGTPVSIRRTDAGTEVHTGAAQFLFRQGGPFPFSSIQVGRNRPVVCDDSGLRIRVPGCELEWCVADLKVHEAGPLRAELEVLAAAVHPGRARPLDVMARIELFAGMATARVEVTVRNTRRALHAGGQWPLGDPGSLMIDAASLVLRLAHPVKAVRVACEIGGHMESQVLPFELLQESSGGEQWNWRVHRNRDGVVPLKFRGYEARAGGTISRGLRASPTVEVATTAGETVAVAVPQFWQNFPRSVTVDRDAVEVGWFPASSGPHELQGGEQKTHAVVLAFRGDDDVSAESLLWWHESPVWSPPPEYGTSTGALPYVLAASDEPGSGYLDLVSISLDATRGFLAKRERADEYGWRNFGDIPADHESALQPVDEPFVSHYNNQYDAVAGFATHFVRTGDLRWWELMNDLAAHVRDIDIYHTDEDKPLYNNGLFWHTNHYVDAGLSTHRTYPAGSPHGGGPSAEHNYNYGLMLHYFLTGDRRSRDTAVALGQWVIDMDDGRRTPLRWLSHAPTGWASYTAGHQGPGRGAGNSIVACLTAHRLTGAARFLDKAEELIVRTVDPRRPVGRRYVEDIEGYWSYTVFLQALGLYLHVKAEAGMTDARFYYARAALLRYARWMAENEQPYLVNRDRLEYPNQTWAAQDLRKADVLQWAALHASGEERSRFLERARFFHAHAVDELGRMDGHWYARPLVLVLLQGVRATWFERYSDRLPAVHGDEPAEDDALRPREAFRSQKDVAVRRLAGVVAAGLGLAAILGAGWLLR